MTEQARTLSRRTFIGGAAAVGALTVAHPVTAFADPSAEKVAVKQQLVNSQAELEEAADNYGKALDDEKTASDAKDAAQKKIDEANKQITTVQAKLSTRARSMYRNGSDSFLDLLLGSTTFEQFATNWDLLSQMNQEDADLVKQSKELRDTVQEQRDEAAKQEKVAKAKAEEASSIKSDTESKISDYQTKLSTLSKKEQEEVQKEGEENAVKASQARMQQADENAGNDNGGTQDNSAGSDGSDNSGASDNNNSGNANSGNSNSGNSNNSNSGGSSSSKSGSSSSSSSSSSTKKKNNSSSSSSKKKNQGSSSSSKKSTTSGSSSSGSGVRSAVLRYARSRLGCKYVWGASGPSTFDCSGLVMWCYAKAGISLDHYTGSQYSQAKRRVSISQARPGDVLYRDGHVGICTKAGGGEYIHAPHTGDVVRVATSQQFSCALQFV